jgi:hypothetical protein
LKINRGREINRYCVSLFIVKMLTSKKEKILADILICYNFKR